MTEKGEGKEDRIAAILGGGFVDKSFLPARSILVVGDPEAARREANRNRVAMGRFKKLHTKMDDATLGKTYSVPGLSSKDSP